jgi:hypothetical protein
VRPNDQKRAREQQQGAGYGQQRFAAQSHPRPAA